MSHSISARRLSTRRWMVTAFAVAALAGIGVAPAAAMQDPGAAQRPAVQQDSRHCFLERIGTQFVRCDDLTGAGVVAPAWVPER